MDATAAPWLQDVGMGKQPASLDGASSSSSRHHHQHQQQQQQQQVAVVEKRARPQKEQALNCPRCNSTNTKFCYYNNYSLTQPRYFCKTCRRYWTEGGSLRNVPVGGGSRKNKRPSSSNAAPSAASCAPSKKLQQDPLALVENPNNKYMETHDLNLSFPHHPFHSADFPRFPNIKTVDLGTDALSAMELLRNGVPSSRPPFMALTAMPEVSPPLYPPAGFVLQDFRSSFPVAGNGASFDNLHEAEGGSGGRVLFPFEDLSQVPSDTTAGNNNPSTFDQRQPDSSGFWSGVMGGGGATW